MDTGLNYQNIIKHVLSDYAEFMNSGGGTPLRLAFDDERQSYLVLMFGWRGDRYIHSATVHIEIIDGQIWIQNDHTEDGIATDLLEAGVPHKDIVLGFRPPELRPYTEFGVGKAQMAAVPADAPAATLSKAA